jgi:hypothetical protein
MKQMLLIFSIVFTAFVSMGQTNDQNPNFAVSRDKYMKMSDSVNRWHSTTSQETYKAIDYMADKEEAREARKQFRRDLRMERAKRGYYYTGWGWPNYAPYYRYNRYYRGAYYNYWRHF